MCVCVCVRACVCVCGGTGSETVTMLSSVLVTGVSASTREERDTPLWSIGAPQDSHSLVPYFFQARDGFETFLW